jgi:uncharacterized protein
MGTVAVRVTPRTAHPGVEVDGDDVVVRVHAPPAEGRATEEARSLIAAALGVPPSRVTLRLGGRSRRKLFDVHGLSAPEILGRLAAR